MLKWEQEKNETRAIAVRKSKLPLLLHINEKTIGTSQPTVLS